jgi:D-aminopeptidase
MLCHGFKGGIGTASRVVGGHTVGVLVQANHGSRERLTINGVPVGRVIGAAEVPNPRGEAPPGGGSIIVIVATDAPLLPGQCTRLAQRSSFGVARTGGAGENGSGDLMLAFATGNRGLRTLGDSLEDDTDPVSLRAVTATTLDALFYAAIEATEEAIVNAMVAGRTMVGVNGNTAHGIPHDRLAQLFAPEGV